MTVTPNVVTPLTRVGRNSGRTMDAVVEQYAQWMRSWGAADKTISARTTVAQSVLAEFGLGFTAENLQEYLGRPKPERQGGGRRSRWTIATYQAHLRSFCEYLVAAGLRAESPMDDVQKARRPKSAPRPLSEVELALVLRTVTGRNRDWIVLALDEGLRAHEIAMIRGEDVTLDGLFVCGKGDVGTSLPTHPDVWEMAQRYPRTGYWFPSPYGGHIKPETISSTISELFTTLGISGSIHRVRHNYGTRLLRLPGVNIRQVQQLMRHATLGSTEVYTAVHEDELRDAINQLPSSA